MARWLSFFFVSAFVSLALRKSLVLDLPLLLSDHSCSISKGHSGDIIFTFICSFYIFLYGSALACPFSRPLWVHV